MVSASTVTTSGVVTVARTVFSAWCFPGCLLEHPPIVEPGRRAASFPSSAVRSVRHACVGQHRLDRPGIREPGDLLERPARSLPASFQRRRSEPSQPRAAIRRRAERSSSFAVRVDEQREEHRSRSRGRGRARQDRDHSASSTGPVAQPQAPRAGGRRPGSRSRPRPGWGAGGAANSTVEPETRLRPATPRQPRRAGGRRRRNPAPSRVDHHLGPSGRNEAQQAAQDGLGRMKAAVRRRRR